MADDRCLNCNEPIRLINFALGKQWLHIRPEASFPSEHKGTAWRHCRGKVATPRPVCPECEQGKHGNCDGTAWDDEADAPTDCACTHKAGT